MRRIALCLSLLFAVASSTVPVRAESGGREQAPVVVELRSRPGFWTPTRMRAARALDLRPVATRVASARRTGADRIAPFAVAPTTPVEEERRIDRLSPDLRSTATIDYERVTIDDPSAFPYRTHGRIFMTLPGGALGSCSGTLVSSANRSVVMTAAHCLLNPDVSGFVTSLSFVPGYENGGSPFGVWEARYVVVAPQWASTISSGGDARYDVGAAVLSADDDRAAGDVVGARGVLFGAEPLQSFTSFGYPAAPPFDGRRLISCISEPGDLLTVWGPPYPAAMGCDMTPGSSGGGWVVDGGLVNAVVSFSLVGRPEVQYGPYFGAAARDVYLRASSQEVPGVTPDPSLDGTTTSMEHDVDLVLRLRRHLYARGRMSALDGYLPCTRNAPINVYRRRDGRWRLIASTRTRDDGVFRIRIPDRRGRYRADSPAGRVNDLNLCSRAVSIPRRHRH